MLVQVSQCKFYDLISHKQKFTLKSRSLKYLFFFRKISLAELKYLRIRLNKTKSFLGNTHKETDRNGVNDTHTHTDIILNVIVLLFFRTNPFHFMREIWTPACLVGLRKLKPPFLGGWEEWGGICGSNY